MAGFSIEGEDVSLSPAQRLVHRDDGSVRPRSERIKILRALGDEKLAALKRDWRFWARPEQLTPAGLWTLWVLLTGRGWGKTRTGAEFVLDRSEKFAERSAFHRVLLVGATVADCRDVMIEGESGLMACAEARGIVCKYEPSLRRVTLPDLGTAMTTFTAEKPDQLRGPQGHTAWADEPAKWKHLIDREGNSAWSNLMLALRLEGYEIPDLATILADDGDDNDLPPFEPGPGDLQPQVVATTTPKPIPIVQEWVKRAKSGDQSIVLTSGSMMENAANLAQRFLDEVQARYVGTRLAAQEIDGVLLEAVEGALWEPTTIDKWRYRSPDGMPALGRIVIAVDPSGSGHGHGDDCGIVVVAVEGNPADTLQRHVYVLEDLTSEERPITWARVVVDAYWRWNATAVVVETNFGAALVRDVLTLTDPNVRVEEVKASKGKRPRAEPVALVYDQGRAHHVGYFGAMEAEMCSWVPDEDMDSPNRMDAVVWGVSFLLPEITRAPASSQSYAEARLPTGAEAMVPGSTGSVPQIPGPGSLDLGGGGGPFPGWPGGSG